MSPKWMELSEYHQPHRNNIEPLILLWESNTTIFQQIKSKQYLKMYVWFRFFILCQGFSIHAYAESLHGTGPRPADSAGRGHGIFIWWGGQEWDGNCHIWWTGEEKDTILSIWWLWSWWFSQGSLLYFSVWFVFVFFREVFCQFPCSSPQKSRQPKAKKRM